MLGTYACAATRKQDATKEELHAVLELKLLEVFQILGCSQLNRQRLIALGCLPALARVIKASHLPIQLITYIQVALTGSM